MINRVLIRIKVVQLLYSFLLTENHFMIESQPSNPTKEKRFAYALYLDILNLIVRIADTVPPKGGRSLADTRFIKKLKTDEYLISHSKKYAVSGNPLYTVLPELAAGIEESAIYKDFCKSSPIQDDDMVWEKIFTAIISRTPSLYKVYPSLPGYSTGGIDRMLDMMKVTFTNFYASKDNIDDARRDLQRSLDKGRELYMRLFVMIDDLTQLRRIQLDENKHKYLRTAEDMNPNTRFIDNALAKAIAHDKDLEEYNKDKKISWIVEDRPLVQTLLKQILESDIYKEYMDFPVTDRHMDVEFWRNVFKQIIMENEDFLEYLETKSVFWNDDLDIIGTFFFKTLRKYEDSDSDSGVLLPMYKDEAASEFGDKLLRYVVKDKDMFKGYIDEFIRTDRWDSDRLAFMDVIITMTALAEIINFPEIPITVTFNEYIELAKSYSTSKSGAFVNGILRSIADKLRKEGKIMK